MANLFEIQAQLDSLLKQRASGVAKVSYNGRTVEYRSLEDIDKAIFRLKDEISAGSGKRKVKQLKTFATKGL